MLYIEGLPSSYCSITFTVEGYYVYFPAKSRTDYKWQMSCFNSLSSVDFGFCLNDMSTPKIIHSSSSKNGVQVEFFVFSPDTVFPPYCTFDRRNIVVEALHVRTNTGIKT